MKFLVALLFTNLLAAQVFPADTLVTVPANPAKGFHHDFILFVPKKTPVGKTTYLLVEPNNTGQLSDSVAVHRKHAEFLASVSSVGNNVSTELLIPLLVPVFPRPASQPLMYTHALDRDVMDVAEGPLMRPDLQLLAMVEEAQKILSKMNVPVHPRFLMSGFSASGTFVNRFSMIHPEKIKALAIGGFNGKLMHPQKQLDGTPLDYPLGIHDFEKRFGKPFDIAAFRSLPQYIYMGSMDDNDSVDFQDAYGPGEREIINNKLSPNVQERFALCRKIYQANGVRANFRVYDAIGHRTTSNINLDVIYFFMEQVKE